MHLDVDAVAVWLASTREGAHTEERYRPLLSPAENARADRMRSPVRRHQFVLGRGMARVVLGALLDAPPRDIAIHTSDAGKPALHGAPLHFNLAHSHELVALAVTAVGPVGIDVEAVRDVRGLHAVAARWFSPREIEALGPGETFGAFLDLWTRKEALLKAWGDGFGRSDPRDHSVLSERVTDPGRTPEAWTLRSFEPAPGYVGAVCAPDARWRLVVRPWESSQTD